MKYALKWSKTKTKSGKVDISVLFYMVFKLWHEWDRNSGIGSVGPYGWKHVIPTPSASAWIVPAISHPGRSPRLLLGIGVDLTFLFQKRFVVFLFYRLPLYYGADASFSKRHHIFGTPSASSWAPSIYHFTTGKSGPLGISAVLTFLFEKSFGLDAVYRTPLSPSAAMARICLAIILSISAKAPRSPLAFLFKKSFVVVAVYRTPLVLR